MDSIVNRYMIALTEALCFSFFFFFFQAEDGIRDFHVTGVQTCALPICLRVKHRQPPDDSGMRSEEAIRPETNPSSRTPDRSEERRVGKECRSRWSRYH